MGITVSFLLAANMETNENGKTKKKTKKELKKDSMAYLRHREKANARKRKFLDNMTEEQKEIKRAKDREYYQKKKAENKVNKISDLTEREKRALRKQWKEASKKYRAKKKMLANAVSNTPPPSDNELDIPLLPLPPSRDLTRKQRGRKKVKKDRTKAYRKILKQKGIITELKRKNDALRKKLNRKEQLQAKKNIVDDNMSPNSKVNDLIKDIPVPVPPQVRKHLLFGEVLSTQLKTNATSLPKNSKEREVFQKCVSGTDIRKYKLLHMAKTFMPKEKNNKTILKSDKKVRELVLKPDVRQTIKDFFQKDDVSRMCPGKRDFVKKMVLRNKNAYFYQQLKHYIQSSFKKLESNYHTQLY